MKPTYDVIIALEHPQSVFFLFHFECQQMIVAFVKWSGVLRLEYRLFHWRCRKSKSLRNQRVQLVLKCAERFFNSAQNYIVREESSVRNFFIYSLSFMKRITFVVMADFTLYHVHRFTPHIRLTISRPGAPPTKITKYLKNGLDFWVSASWHFFLNNLHSENFSFTNKSSCMLPWQPYDFSA